MSRILVSLLFACLASTAWAADGGAGVLGGERPGGRVAGGGPGNGGGVAFTGELLGGREEGSGVTSGWAALALALYKGFGAEIEALDYRAGDDRFAGVGAHAYWRDPELGLIGLTASRSSADIAAADGVPALSGVVSKTYGLEAELYLGAVTAALQQGRIDSDLAAFDGENYTSFDALWWASERWYWLGGARRIADSTTDRLETGYTSAVSGAPLTVYGGGTWDAFKGQYLGLEYTPWRSGQSGWVVFAELDRGEDGYHAAFFGVRYGFGPVRNAPLISLFDRVTGGF